MSSQTTTAPIAARALSRIYLPEGLRRSLIPFLLSRVLIVIIFTIVPLALQVPPAEWSRNDSLSIKLTGSAITDGLQRVAHANDAGWYINIAQNGYEHRPFDTERQANWAFFPLHPYLWRGAAAVTGEWLWSGILLANLFMLGGLALLWHLAERMTGSKKHADNAVLFAAFWPTTYFMLLPHTEAMFFMLATLSFLAAHQQRWWLSGLAGMFAGATRLNGLFLLPALWTKWWQGERQLRDLLKLMPIGFGLVAFMVYLWFITGNPLAFKDIQVTWGREFTAPWAALLDYTGRPLKIAIPWNPKLLNFSMTMLGIASVVTCWRRGWRGLAVFTMLTILAPLCTGTLMSMTRYLGVAPGIFLALTIWADKRPYLGQILLVLFTVSMTLLCTAFAAGINIGGA